MKARQDFTIFVNTVGTPVSHQSGDSLKGIKKIVVKKGEVVPKDLHSHFLQFTSDLIDLTTVTDNERKQALHPIIIVKPKPSKKIEKKKFTKQEINYMNKEKQIALLKKLGWKGSIPRREKSLIALILKLQEEK